MALSCFVIFHYYAYRCRTWIFVISDYGISWSNISLGGVGSGGTPSSWTSGTCWCVHSSDRLTGSSEYLSSSRLVITQSQRFWACALHVDILFIFSAWWRTSNSPSCRRYCCYCCWFFDPLLYCSYIERSHASSLAYLL